MRRPTVPVLALVALVVLATACSGAPQVPLVGGQGSSKSPVTAPHGGPLSPGALGEMMAYSKCMRSHGVLDFPDPTPNPGGPGGSLSWSGTGPDHDLDPSNPRYQAANEVCQPLLPDAGQVPPISAKQLAVEVRMAVCMRSHGVPDFPDPDNTDGAFDLSNLDRGSSRYQAVFNGCVRLTGFKGPMRVPTSRTVAHEQK